MKTIFKTILFAIAGFVLAIIGWKLIDNAANYTAWVVMAGIVAIVYLIVRITGSDKV